MQYRSEIDGLRALAIIPVVFFHGGFSFVSGGFVGVDVFFVISGYLITLLIYKDIQKQTFSAKKFYERRIKRLFPALLFMALCCTIAAWLLYQPFDLEYYFRNLASVFAFASNVQFYHHSGYFDPSSELNVLLHTWSLTVEEQFYFVFPWLIVLAVKLGKKFVWLTVISLILISLGLAEWRLENKPMAAFYLLYARGWELLIGSFCALIVSDSKLVINTPKYIRECLAWLGLSLILFSIFVYTEATPTPGRYILLPTLGTALIILFANSAGSLGRLLSSPQLVFIGLLSYSTYLWHQPLLAFAKYLMGEEFNLILSGILCVLSFVIGYLSWKYIENPFRYGKFGWNTQRRVFSTSIALGICIVAMGLYGEKSRGFPERLDSNVRSIYQTAGHYEQVETCFITVSDSFDLPGCLERTGANKNVLIVGDSHAASLFPSLKTKFNENGWHLSMLTYARCVPFIGEELLEPYKANSRFLSKHINSRCKNVKKSFINGVSDKKFDFIIVLNHYNNWMGAYAKNTFDGFLDMYADSIINIFDHNNLVVLGPLPIWVDDLPKLIVKDYAQGKDYLGPSFSGLFDKDSRLDKELKSKLDSRGVRFISSMEAFCSNDGCKRIATSSNGEKMALAYDEAHLSPAGAEILSNFVVKSLIGENQKSTKSDDVSSNAPLDTQSDQI